MRATVIFIACVVCCVSGVVALAGALAPRSTLGARADDALSISIASAQAALVYRMAYTLWPMVQRKDFRALARAISAQTRTNGFQYVVYGVLISTSPRPSASAPAVTPLVVLAAYQAAARVDATTRGDANEKSAWRTLGLANAFEKAQENMAFALVLCAALEISAASMVLMETATPRRSFSRLFAWIAWLRARYHCRDNTVFRIKFTAHDTAFYHREVWGMLNEKIYSRAPAPVRRVCAPIVAWFTRS